MGDIVLRYCYRNVGIGNGDGQCVLWEMQLVMLKVIRWRYYWLCYEGGVSGGGDATFGVYNLHRVSSA